MDNKKKFLMIDGSSLTFRAFYAIRNLTTQDGIHTNAIYGFLTMLFSAIDKVNPDYIFVAFDKKGPTFRTEEYGEYKGTREKTPEELNHQFGILRDILEHMNIKHLALDKYEADDIIGTLSKEIKDDNLYKYLLTGDRDYFQLVDDDTSVLYTIKGISNLKEFDKKEIEKKYGLSPDKLIEVKGLMGDSSDNIPGVPGIGEKRAIDLIKEYGSIEGVYENIDKITAKKMKENLIENEDIAYMSKKLGTIYRDIDLDCDLESYKVREIDKEELEKIFTKLEFRGFLNKLGIEKEIDEIEVSYEYVKNDFDLESFLRNESISFKVYFDGDIYSKSEFKYFSVKGNGEDIAYIFDRNSDISIIKNILESDLLKYSFNIKEDMVLFNKEGIDISDPYRDTMIMEYLIDPSRTNYDISGLTSKYLEREIRAEEEVLGKGAKKKSLDNIDKEDLYKYITSEIFSLEELSNILENELIDLNMHDLYLNIENKVTRILANMEIHGFLLDQNILDELDEEFSNRIRELERKIWEEAGEDFNINSPKQLGNILFEKLDYPVIKKTKTGYSTSQDVLDKLKNAGPIPSLVLDYRSLAKLKSTYVDGLREVVDKDNRIRTTFRQDNTATGRLSSQDPNLQNIPIRTDEGKLIRKAFVVPEGYKLIDADYSQIELRVLAHLANDENMLDAFKHGIDIHRKTASEVFNVPVDEVTPLQRSNAKAVNFGIVYGISSYGLSQDLNISREEAQSYIDGYMSSYPNISKYMEEIVEDAKEKGYVETITHRRRYIEELSSRNRNIRNFGERIALNTPIQGSAADIIKMAMIDVSEELEKRGLKSKLILQVHDELLVETKDEEVDEVIEILKDKMENTVKLNVDLKVDIEIGDTWYETH